MNNFLKKTGAVILMCTMLGGITACNTAGKGDNTSESTDSGKTEETYNPFNPFWESETMYNEPVVLVKNATTGVISGKLLFAPTEVIEIRNYSLEKTFAPSMYTVDGNVIRASDSSTMPFMTEAQLTGKDGDSYGWTDYNGSGVAFTEGVGIVMMQVNVTYKHTGEWNVKPTCQKDKLTNVIQKLENGEDINLFVFGDSISTGANSSGKLGIKPYLPTYPEGVKSQLEKKYGVNVNLFNGSYGGWKSQEGLQNVAATIPTGNNLPDLAIVGFGMNDGSWNVSADTYQDNVLRIIAAIRSVAPDCDVVLISTILANPDSPQNTAYTPQYLAKDKELANDVERVAHVDMTTFSKELYKTKRSVDILANNINHPNDFLVRGYVANIVGTITDK